MRSLPESSQKDNLGYPHGEPKWWKWEDGYTLNSVKGVIERMGTCRLPECVRMTETTDGQWTFDSDEGLIPRSVPYRLGAGASLKPSCSSIPKE